VACHVQPFDPRHWQPMSLDTEAPLASVSAAHLYTMPGTGSVNTAVDLEGLKYLSGLLGLHARWRATPFPHVTAL
jgi:hypothetical protein